MTPGEIERKILSSINSLDRLSHLKLSNINQFSFVVYRDIYNFIADYYKNYSSFPAKALLEASFTNFIKDDEASDSEFEYLISELNKVDVQRKANKILEKGITLLQNDPMAAVDYLVNKLALVKKPVKYAYNYTDKNAMKRLELYEEKMLKRKSGIQIGIKTGISFFDEKYIGWNPGNLIGIVARLGVGKSFMLLYLACIAYEDGRKVLFISPEMTIEEVEARWDVILAYLRGYKFSNEALLSGGKVNKSEYAEFLETTKERSDWVTYDSYEGKQFSVSVINSLIQEHQPDLVAIDGLPLLSDDLGAGQSWENVKNVSYGLKSVAQQNKVVALVTTQATREASKRNDSQLPELHQVAYGDAFAQAANMILTIGEDKKNPNIRYIKIPKNRNGRIYTKRAKISFDVDIGRIGESLGIIDD